MTKDFYFLMGVDFNPYLFNFINKAMERHWVGIDRGAYYLVEQGIKPYLSIGDFDSVNLSEREKIEENSSHFIVLPEDKDYTDTELALLEIINHYPQANFHLLSDSRSRLDHLMNTMWMPAKDEFKQYAEQIFYYDVNNTVSYLLPGQHKLQKEEGKSIVAFGSLLPIKNLSLQGFEYSLQAHDMGQAVMYTSNRFLGQVGRISFDEGLLMVIQTKKN